MGLINIDFNDTINKAGSLDRIGSEISGMSRNGLSGIGGEIASCWKGDSSSKYLKKYNKINNCIYNKGRELKTIASGIDRDAKRLKSVEDYALALFGKRK